MSNLFPIADILTRTNCLVIPGLGGFIGTYQNAQYLGLKNTLKPPGKVIVFNPKLVLNDGLLVHELTTILDITPTQAITELEHRVAQLKAELNSGKRIEFEKVGFLFNDESGQIKFIQDTRNNLLKSSFGLTAVTLQPVNNSSANAFSIPEYNSIKLPKQTTSTTKNTIQKNTANRVISINPKWAVAALTIPAIVAFGWWMRNNKVLDKNINMAGFSVAENTYQPINYNWEENTTAPAVTIPDTAGIYSLKLTELPNVKPLIVKVEAKADSLLVKKPTIEKIKTAVFGIIGGCFSNIENAQNFTQQLITEGYSAKIAGVSPNGLNRVVFGQYNSRTEAVWWLAQIKQKYPNAWITEIK